MIFGLCLENNSIGEKEHEEMKHEKILLVTLLCACFLFANLAVAEENENDGYLLDEIVSTATKTSKKLENVPAVVTIITSEEIESASARTVGDLLGDLHQALEAV
jgi:outer membrane cobalamin receptor